MNFERISRSVTDESLEEWEPCSFSSTLVRAFVTFGNFLSLQRHHYGLVISLFNASVKASWSLMMGNTGELGVSGDELGGILSNVFLA